MRRQAGERMNLDDHISELLHLDDIGSNKLMDLGASGSTYYIVRCGGHPESSLAEGVMRVMLSRRGKGATTALTGSSAAEGEEQSLSGGNNFDWNCATGSDPARVKDSAKLHRFIDNAYREINLKGNNPVYLTVGAIEWKVAAAGGAQTVVTPLLVFPIRLVRRDAVSPVTVEFVEDDAYFNPCLYHRLRRDRGAELAEAFPLPGGSAASADEPIDMSSFRPSRDEYDFSYFDRVEEFAESLTRDADENTVFRFKRNTVAIVTYNHGEMCMYFDIRRNLATIEHHPLVERVFERGSAPPSAPAKSLPDLVLPADSVQEDIIARILDGESMIIKGPPGTGKTLTIANLVAALMGEGKKVLFASKKLSALGEVHAKLPDNLRKFALLLEGETEKQAASVNRAEITKALRAVVDARREYSLPLSAEGERMSAESDEQAAFGLLRDYHKFMFETKYAIGMTGYEILDESMKRAGLPCVGFTRSRALLGVTADEFAAARRAASEADQKFDALTGGGSHAADKCPWYGIREGVLAEEALADYSDIACDAENALAAADGVAARLPGADGISMFALREVFAGETDKKTVAAVAEAAKAERTKKSGVLTAVVKAHKKYSDAAAASDDAFVFKGGDAGGLATALAGCGLPGEAPVSVLKDIALHPALFGGASGDGLTDAELDLLIGKTELLRANAEAEAKETEAIRKAFSEQAEQELASLPAARMKALAEYAESGREKPRFTDFAARSAFKKLAAASYVKGVTFPEIAAAANAYNARERLRGERVGLVNRLNQSFGRALNEDETRCLTSVLDYILLSGGDGGALVRGTVTSRGTLLAALSAFAEAPFGADICGLSAALVREREKDALFAALKKFGETYPLVAVTDREGAPATAAAVRAVAEICAAEDLSLMSGEEIAELLGSLRDERAAAAIDSLKIKAERFGKRHFAGVYTRLPLERTTPRDWRIFLSEAESRSVLGAALGYAALKKTRPCGADMQVFFRPFEETGRRPGSFGDIFARSFFRALASELLASLGRERNGCYDRVKTALGAFGDAERRLAAASALRIEQRCMQRIDPRDPDLAFVYSDRGRSSDAAVRKLFKEHPSAMLKLIRCFILSPSSVSLLFRPEEYSTFDVVIVDEASQLEPVTLLPLLFRAKQCVLVGDEHQMPPITHFRAKNTASRDDGDYDPDISALSLALVNERFAVTELVCHYRSATESLIKYSQKRFYPNMRTFPAAVPKIAGELGLRSVYVEGGVFEGSRNEREAKAVVDCLRAHFDRYYDEKTGRLAESVGVVVFNEKQLEFITSLVERDGKLSSAVSRARAADGDVPDKTVFFKTILTVQGQEAAHLILGLTYGRNMAGGAVSSFGDLNSNRHGRCVFNVAVTRAQKSVTLVHSLHSWEITNDNLSFIKDYIRLVEDFAADERGVQFVSAPPRDGFVSSVARALAEAGVPEHRIVQGYGVTEGSVRIPIAVLSEDGRSAVLGIMCETALGRKYNYIDYNVRYHDILAARGWRLRRLGIQEWFDDGEGVIGALTALINETTD